MVDSSPTLGFRQRVHRSDGMRGSFVKFADPASVEIFGAVGMDFVVIDQEHGVFDRATLNISLLAARAARIPAIVRVPTLRSDAIACALDCGASGILAPHVSSADDARALVAACRYRNGARGFSGVTRAGGYGSNGLWNHIDASDAGIAAIAMIEDPAALSQLDEILRVDGLDAIFIGRGDLTVALNAPTRMDTKVVQAIEQIFQAAKRHHKPVWVMVDNIDEVRALQASGATSFIVSSDQSLLRKAAADIADKLISPGQPPSA